MTINKSKSPYLIFAAMLLAVVAWAQAPNSGQTMEGVWNVALAFDRPGLPPCAPAPTIAVTTAPGRGTLIAESCWAFEGAGYGSWSQTGHNQFAAAFQGNSFGANGIVMASYKVRATLTLNPNANGFSGPFQTQLLDLSGNVLDTLTGRVDGVRIEP
jgi:hypothetical protein